MVEFEHQIVQKNHSRNSRDELEVRSVTKDISQARSNQVREFVLPVVSHLTTMPLIADARCSTSVSPCVQGRSAGRLASFRNMSIPVSPLELLTEE